MRKLIYILPFLLLGCSREIVQEKQVEVIVPKASGNIYLEKSDSVDYSWLDTLSLFYKDITIFEGEGILDNGQKVKSAVILKKNKTVQNHFEVSEIKADTMIQVKPIDVNPVIKSENTFNKWVIGGGLIIVLGIIALAFYLTMKRK